MMIEIETLNAKHEIRGGSQNTFLHRLARYNNIKTILLLCYPYKNNTIFYNVIKFNTSLYDNEVYKNRGLLGWKEVML